MHLSKHDLFQMTDEWLQKLPADLLLEVSRRLLHDVQELQDRLNQNPDNSSRPPTSQPPWAKTGGSEEQDGAADERDSADVAAEPAGSSTEETEQAPPVDGQRPSAKKGSGKRPGKQPGSPGHGRSQKLVITARCEHRPGICAACAAALPADAVSQAYTAWDEVVMVPPVDGRIGLTFRVTRHTLVEVSCSCGHVSRAQTWRAPADGQWEKVVLAESSDARVAGVGQEMEGIMKTLMAAIYTARTDPPPEALPARYANEIERLRHLCEAHRMDDHSVLHRFVREFLYDWNVILRPVAEPHLPLSNNAAEEALRHWVNSRCISHSTRCEERSRAFAFLACLIEICRRRGASAWHYLGTVIAAARKGLQPPRSPPSRQRCRGVTDYASSASSSLVRRLRAELRMRICIEVSDKI